MHLFCTVIHTHMYIHTQIFFHTYLNDDHEEQKEQSLNGSVGEDGANAWPVKLEDVFHIGAYTITGAIGCNSLL